MGHLWEIGLLLLFATNFLAIWRLKFVGWVISMLTFYGYFQVSSAYYLMPYYMYKDGGNGVGLLDFNVWIMWATLCCTMQGLLYFFVKWLLGISKK